MAEDKKPQVGLDGQPKKNVPTPANNLTQSSNKPKKETSTAETQKAVDLSKKVEELQKTVLALSTITPSETCRLRLESVRAILQFGTTKSKENAIKYGDSIFQYIMTGKATDDELGLPKQAVSPPVPKGQNPNTY